MTLSQLIDRELHARYRSDLARYAARHGITKQALARHLDAGTVPEFIAFDLSEALGMPVRSAA